MLLLSCWTILVIILTNFKPIQATKWNATVCFTLAWGKSLRITLNKDNYKNVSYQSNQECFSTDFELNDEEKPSYIKVNPYHGYKAIVQNKDLQETYAVRCWSGCKNDQKLEKSVYWNIEVIRSEINDNDKHLFYIKPYGGDSIKFKRNSRTSNTFIFLPMEMNSKSRIELSLTTGKFWLNTIVKLKNMETSDIYSCIYVLNQNTSSHECSLTNDKNWLMIIVSPEVDERNFTIEIIQDKLSSFSRNLKWTHFSVYGDSYIKYFNLKTYEEDEITSLKLHFFDKSLKINEISLINNYSEYKFKTNGESKIQNNSVMEFTRITKEKEEKIHSTETTSITTTVIGFIAVIILFLIIIIICLYIRYKKLRNSISNAKTSTPQDVAQDNHYPVQNITPVHITEPSRESFYAELNLLDIAEDNYCPMQDLRPFHNSGPNRESSYLELNSVDLYKKHRSKIRKVSWNP